MPIFDFRDYREFLARELPTTEEKRGARKKLASYLGCQPAFISQVLNFKMHLSEEMAFATCTFLQLSEHEVRYFLLLYHFNRAGTSPLRTHYESELKRQLAKRTEVKRQISNAKSLDKPTEAQFFSNPLFLQIVLLCGLKPFQTKAALQNRLRCEPAELSAALDFLEASGLIKVSGSRISSTQLKVYLDRKSSYISSYHAQWRGVALPTIFRNLEDELHLSYQFTCSLEDFRKMKREIMAVLSKIDKIVDASTEPEDVFVWTTDLFRMP